MEKVAYLPQKKVEAYIGVHGTSMEDSFYGRDAPTKCSEAPHLMTSSINRSKPHSTRRNRARLIGQKSQCIDRLKRKNQLKKRARFNDHSLGQGAPPTNINIFFVFHQKKANATSLLLSQHASEADSKPKQCITLQESFNFGVNGLDLTEQVHC